MSFQRALLFICLLACPVLAQAQKVSVEYDGAGDFSKYKTYDWKKAGVPAKNPYVNEQIVTALDRQLQARGLRKVEEGGSLHVIYYVAVDRDLEISGGTLTGAPALIGPGGSTISGQAWVVYTGTLAVGLFDSSTGKIVWRGTAKEPLDDRGGIDLVKQARKVEKPIRKSIEKMFKKFPAS
jgi:hypothetical protein